MSIAHLHPGETVTVYATPESPKRVSVAGGTAYHEGADTSTKRKKLDGSVLIEGAFTFVGGSVISVESVEKKAPRKPRPSETKAKKAAPKKSKKASK